MFLIDTIKFFFVDSEYARRDLVEVWPFVQCHHSWSKVQKFPMYERGGKGIRFLFKEYQDSLPQDKGSVGFKNFHDIVKLLTTCSDPKYGLSK